MALPCPIHDESSYGEVERVPPVPLWLLYTSAEAAEGDHINAEGTCTYVHTRRREARGAR